MRKNGQISIKGIVQGVGFRPFVFAAAVKFGITGNVRNLGSEVLINAWGDHFEEFLCAVAGGTPLSRIDSVDVREVEGHAPEDFSILESTTGALSGFIPADVATCEECLADIMQSGGRYEGYWATSCVNCGPRYSIIHALPYDRERTTMDEFPLCRGCSDEYTDPGSRRHHAQTIACHACGPSLALLDRNGEPVQGDPIPTAAGLLDDGAVIAVKGLGGFHIACIESSASRLKGTLGRPEQPLAVMAEADEIRRVAHVSPDEEALLSGPAHPIVVLEKKDPASHMGISKLHTLGCMLPYTALHHLLFRNLRARMLIMTSANEPGEPMMTTTESAFSRLADHIDYYLTHNRRIENRCDDSVVRDGYIIRLSRGLAPKRIRCDLGDISILGVGPELNSNVSVYHGGFLITSPHVGNVRNPSTLAYLKETAETIRAFTGASCDIIAHDLHPQFLSTRYAWELAARSGARLVPVQHHRAHIAATTTEPCIGIAIDGVGYGDDGTIWGGEIFAGQVPDLRRVGHLEQVLMPGGDLATRFPERMLYGMLPDDSTLDLLAKRGWSETERNILARQVDRRFNVSMTSSTGRVLDAAAALLGICREKTFDGEPAQVLESAAFRGTPTIWERECIRGDGMDILLTSAIMKKAREASRTHSAEDIAASFQATLATGIAEMAVRAAHEEDIDRIALSGGVAYNRFIRETILAHIKKEGLTPVINREYPLGDGCISAGQCIWASAVHRQEKN
ncbi:hydrogenase maturation protein HypF [Methanomicrobiaceae archaeon CYW5]|uniref:carbamoyltransferase HypF n=1 Tax=Methanovulcanius yangii TaxID=1789227 RepID=UPI0029C9FCA7|nr:carbamoyltransferase HypF [Methanovulcanius yangii]MBT8508183.1 hydrogenase maturation protein HypF [Methanovulcanius yangii]